eukprot:7072892-Pyramimonas_sp.AAC.1
MLESDALCSRSRHRWNETIELHPVHIPTRTTPAIYTNMCKHTRPTCARPQMESWKKSVGHAAYAAELGAT